MPSVSRRNNNQLKNVIKKLNFN